MRADLSEAYLEGANLTKANLTFVNLKTASLGDANFTGAGVAQTLFINVDLRVVKGLDTLIHLGPSTISIDTLYRSNGQIPEIFLRSAGIPQDFITAIRPLFF